MLYIKAKNILKCYKQFFLATYNFMSFTDTFTIPIRYEFQNLLTEN